MKKLLSLLLAVALLMMTFSPALAEDLIAPPSESKSPLAPFDLSIPADWTVMLNGSSVTFVSGNTRVVAMVISRVGDVEADHQAALATLIKQFSPEAQEAQPLTLTPGFYGLQAVTADALEGAGEGNLVDQLTVMVLWQTALQGELLILSGYDMTGDNAAVQAMLDAILSATTVNDAPVLPLPEADAELPLPQE